MIHNRTVKETRRYDIFKLVVLLGLLVLLIFMVWRDDELSRAADGDGTTTAEGAEAAYPAGDEAQSPAGDEAAYPGEDEAAYPAGDGDLDQAPPADAPGYPGADESGEQADDSESGQETASDQSGTGEDTLQILSPAPGAEVQSGFVLFSGTGAPGSQVSILADGNELGQTNVTDNGNWQLEVNIPAGETTIEVQSVDANGSGTTTTPPMDLVVTDPTTDQPPEMTIADDALFAGSSELSGSGIPGTTVAVIVDDQQVATAVVAEDGSWSAPVELATGDQTIVLQTISIEGTIINESEPLEVTVQETINPTVDLPIVNLFAYGMTLTGSGQPNSEVQIIANELPVAETTVNVEGTWTATVNLQAGTYNIDVAALDSSGNPIEQIPGLSLPVLPLPGPQLRLTESSVPEFDPISGVYVWPGVAEPGTEVAVLFDGNVVGTATAAEDGSWSLETELEPGTYDLSLAEMDESGNVSAESEPGSFDLGQQPPTVDLPAESTAGSESEVPAVNLTAGEFTWSGQAEPNSQVAIMIDNETAVTVVADESGNWTAEGELDSGEYELQLAVIDEGGNVISKSEPLPLNVTPAQQPVMNPLELDSSNGNATVSGTTAPNKTVNLVINGAVLESTISDAGGIYSFAIRLGPGSYEIQVQTVSADGTVEMTSDPETVEVSAVIPAADTETTAEADEDAAETTEPGVEEADVIDAVDVRGEFSTLLTGLESAGLTGQLSDVDEPYTLFAPDDDAFAALPDEVIDGWNQNPESYAEIMFYLVLEGSYTQEQLLQAQVLTTIGGTNIGITTDGETNLVNGVPILESIPAGKSIVHGVEQVILPPIGYDVQPPIINVSGVAVFTGTYLTVVGTAEPGKQILLQVSGENFGEIVTIDENGSWQVADNISPGVHEILAYMLDDNGTLMAISQLVSLPVQ